MGGQGTGYMRKVLIDLFFADSNRLGEFPGIHLPIAQEINHLLTFGLQVILMSFHLFPSPAQEPLVLRRFGINC